MNRKTFLLWLRVALSLLVFQAGAALAAETEEPIHLTVGQSQVISPQEMFERVSVNNESIVEVVVISPREILIHGREPGATSMIVWRPSGPKIYDVIVAPYQRNRFESFLRTILPDETNLQAYESTDTIVLSGSVKHPASLAKAMEAAKATAKAVVNLTDLKDPKQVLIEVRIAEVQRSFARSIGVDYWFQENRFSVGGYAAGALEPQTPTTPQFTRIDASDILLSPVVSNLMEFREGSFDLQVALQALEEKGLLRILAEPNLIAMSGEEASFLAGGEFPIPVVQSTGGGNAVTILFKEFGIKLNFKPIVTSADTVRLSVAPEVSVLDFGASAVEVGGFNIPGLITRRANTTVEMRPGESLVIGGLLSQSSEKAHNRVPILGSIPVLGALFSSKAFENKETELLVLVTPRLLSPQTLPLAPVLNHDAQKLAETFKEPAKVPYRDKAGDQLRRNVHPPLPKTTKQPPAPAPVPTEAAP